MVSNFPRLFATADELTARPERGSDTQQADWSAAGRMVDKVREAFCGLHGHDTLLQFQQDRMFLKCVSCGHESPGWELNETPPTVAARGENRRPALVSPQLIGARRIA